MVYHLRHGEDILNMMKTDPQMAADYVYDALHQTGHNNVSNVDQKRIEVIKTCAKATSSEGLEVCMVRNARALSEKFKKPPTDSMKTIDNDSVKMFDRMLEELDDDIGGMHMVEYNEHLM